jgi:hypothetical protein
VAPESVTSSEMAPWANQSRSAVLIDSNFIERRMVLFSFELDNVHLQKDDENPVRRYDGTMP